MAQRTFTEQGSGFKILLETGSVMGKSKAERAIAALTDNYMQASCPLAQWSPGGFIVWNPPPQKDPNDPLTAYMGIRYDPAGDAFYFNEYDRRYLDSLQALETATGITAGNQ